MVPRLGGAVGVGVELGLTPNWAARLRISLHRLRLAQRDVSRRRPAVHIRVSRCSRCVSASIISSATTASIPVFSPRARRRSTSIGFRFKARPLSSSNTRRRSARLIWARTASTRTRAARAGTSCISSAPSYGRAPNSGSIRRSIRVLASSNTEGIAGYPSGASFKVGASVPYARVQRAFVRQTIDLGGDSQKVEADQNQFAGSNTADRLVITIGKYSVSDVFDQNKYAQNPRKDFMNWALIDTGTFDYAADAWGYSYGAAAEWYEGQWTLRGRRVRSDHGAEQRGSRSAFQPVPMARRNRAPLRAVEPSRQDRVHRLSYPRPPRHL